MDLLTTISWVGLAVITFGVIAYAIGKWQSRQESRPQPIDELRESVHERRRRESLRRAAATEYRDRERGERW